MLKIITWNINQRGQGWRHLVSTGADIALLQEAKEPPPDVLPQIRVDSAPWCTAGAGATRPWRAVVVKLSNRVGVEWLEPKSVPEAHPSEGGKFGVSRPGTLAAAIVTPVGGEPFVVASMYAMWEHPHPSTGNTEIYADGSVHRLISDLSGLIGAKRRHRIIAAGDLNILYGYGENGSAYWAARYDTIFARMRALGLSFVGPQAPCGRLAEPWPKELPLGSKNVPTYYTGRQTPLSATRQLDFVFASNFLAERVRVRALNDPNDWGPSDHCSVEIDVDEDPMAQDVHSGTEFHEKNL
ncbi:MAG TPA: endonuclease/exonuclease/phosphatase family protein [Terriglobales bacterium]